MYVWEQTEFDRRGRANARVILHLVLLVIGIAGGYFWHAYRIAHVVCE
jgi:uncharacterized membrane protein